MCARKTRFDDLVEFQPGITGPAGDLIGHAQADVETVRLFAENASGFALVLLFAM
ncbi:hypothetical protein NIA69_11060 [Gemmiger formicilis]|nr:hypothetical protein [Gemmiger formicilis]